MAIPTEIANQVLEYSSKYRGPALGALEFSRLYELEPDGTGDFYGWPKDVWPHNGKPGVYLLLGKAMDLRYVGSARDVGKRLAAHFQYREDRGCRIVGNWIRRPYFILAVRVTEPFEALSLEQYLISTLSPAENKRGAP